MSTNTDLDPVEIITYYVRRGQIEVTFTETRAHLGVKTQRQLNEKAILRTTPSLLALYSLVIPWASDLLDQNSLRYAASWYKKSNCTFSDAMGAVRMILWEHDIYRQSTLHRDIPKIPPGRIKRMAEALALLHNVQSRAENL